MGLRGRGLPALGGASGLAGAAPGRAGGAVPVVRLRALPAAAGAPEVGFEGRSRGAGAQGGEPGDLVEGLEPGEAPEVEGDDRRVAGEDVDAAGHRGAAAPGDDPHPLPRRGPEDALDLIVVARAEDGVGQRGDGAAAQPQQVGEPLPPGVGQPIEGIGGAGDGRSRAGAGEALR